MLKAFKRKLRAYQLFLAYHLMHIYDAEKQKFFKKYKNIILKNQNFIIFVNLIITNRINNFKIIISYSIYI